MGDKSDKIGKTCAKKKKRKLNGHCFETTRPLMHTTFVVPRYTGNNRKQKQITDYRNKMKLKGANPRGLLVQPTLNPSVLRCGYARSVIAFDGSKSTKRCFGLRDEDWTKTRGFGERGLVTGNGGLERFLRGLRERIARASRY